ncbi:MAG: hypothetical protein ABWK00_00690 [Desulfurococcaceae archaeon]
MGLSGVMQLFSGLSASGTAGAGTIIFAIGFGIILAMAIGILVLGLVRFIKSLPNMSLSGFLKFMLVLAVVLMVIGIIVP